VTGGDEPDAEVIASARLNRREGLVVVLERDDGDEVTVVLPPDAVNWDAVVEAGRAAA
jgi:hypothetical protein